MWSVVCKYRLNCTCLSVFPNSGACKPLHTDALYLQMGRKWATEGRSRKLRGGLVDPGAQQADLWEVWLGGCWQLQDRMGSECNKRWSKPQGETLASLIAVTGSLETTSVQPWQHRRFVLPGKEKHKTWDCLCFMRKISSSCTISHLLVYWVFVLSPFAP